MSGLKYIFLLILITFIGAIIYLEASLLGNPDSNFNQTTRFSIAQYGFLRSIFKLHNAGDARKEYLTAKGPIAITWFKPYSLSLDKAVLDKFVAEITRATGRSVNITFGGNLEERGYNISDLSSENLKALVKKPEGSSMLIFFVKDYKPRQSKELSTTYNENGIIISMDSHQQHLQDYGGTIEAYFLSSLLHEFGHQIGLSHNEKEDCIMNPSAGTGYRSFTFGGNPPSKFCSYEESEINKLKEKLK